MNVKENGNRIERYDSKKETKRKRKFRDLLDLDKKVLVLAVRIRKNNTPRNVYKARYRKR